MSDEKHLCCLKSSLRHDWSTYKLFISLMYHMKPEAINIINMYSYIIILIFTRNNIVWVLSNRTTYLTHPPSIMSPSTTALQRNWSHAIFFIHQRSSQKKKDQPNILDLHGRGQVDEVHPRPIPPGDPLDLDYAVFLFWNFL